MRRRPLSPLWLSRPSRFAGLSRTAGAVGLALLLLLIAATLLSLGAPAPPASTGDPAKHAEEQADVVLYETIVENIRHGGSYYPTVAEALRTGNYPLKPFVTFRLPTLAMVQAALPVWGVLALLWVLVAGVAIAWWRVIAASFANPRARIIAAALLAGGLMAFVQRDLMAFHEIWAGLLIALSLALRRPGEWLPAMCMGLAAALIRETATPYLALMGLFAWLEGERREALGWIGGIAVVALALAAHAQAVSEVVRPLDRTSPGWAGMLGFGFFVRTMVATTALSLLPMLAAAPLVGLALFGWTAWPDARGLRVVALLAGYAAILGVAGRVDTFYWGLLVAPLALIGLAAVPDGLRDLFSSVADRRRITVRRVVR